MKAKLFKYLSLPCALVMLGNTSVLADGQRGIITEYNVSPLFAQGVCIKLNPPFPNTERDLACVFKDNPSYKEISDLLLEGFSSRKTCTVYSLVYRGNIAAIDSAACFN